MPIETHPFISGKWAANLPPPLPGNSWFINDQSFGYFPNSNIKSVFLGTFPTFDIVNNVVPGNLEFFYGDQGNNFWPIMRLITGQPLFDEQQIFAFLNNKAEFGITDIQKKVDRNGIGSADTDLNPPPPGNWVFNDIIGLLQSYPCLTNIYVTSGGKGPITPGAVSAAGWLRAAIEGQGCHTTGFGQTSYQKLITVSLNGRSIWKFKLIYLFSPAGTANVPIQRVINGSPLLQGLIAGLPPIYHFEGMPNKGRIVQWAYLLYLNHFPLDANLHNFITANIGVLGGLFP